MGKAVRVLAYYGIAIRPPYSNYPSSKLWKWARVKEHIIWLVYTLTREYFNKGCSPPGGPPHLKLCNQSNQWNDGYESGE